MKNIKSIIREEILFNEDILKYDWSHLDPNAKYHASFNEFKDIESKQQKPSEDIYGKPTGLWYAMGHKWIRYMIDELSNRAKHINYLYEITTNNNLCVLKTAENVIDFTNTYHMLNGEFAGKGDKYLMGIDWLLVSKNYAGIEIPCYDTEHLHSWYRKNGAYSEIYSWLFAWDVPSGCIWDASGLKSIDLIFSQDKRGKQDPNSLKINPKYQS
jgi:hypothetical protein